MQNIIQKIRISLSGIYPEYEILSLTRLIVEHITGQSLPLLLSDKNKQITPAQEQNIDKIIQRLKTFEPIQYIIGETEFFGLPFVVNKNVLIPRPETEELVELIINENRERKNLRILDIGTGSGCIAISLKKNLPDADVRAWDFSKDALDTAALNAKKNGTDIILDRVDILSEYPASNTFDIIVSNPPYVMDSEKEVMHQNVLSFEPHSALFVADSNPLLFYLRIADIAKNLLEGEGRLYFEINREKGQETIIALQDKGFTDIQLIKDISGNDRIIRADYNKQV